MSGDGSRKTILDLSITIPNTKSSSKLKLSDYINLDERLEESIKDVTFLIQRGLFINITIKGEIYKTIDSNRFVRSLKKLENETGCKWKGNLKLHYTMS
tara:strand:+ start:293 stop:589 length:297 start_codon:yes stop_codon:yes gene_type:complete